MASMGSRAFWCECGGRPSVLGWAARSGPDELLWVAWVGEELGPTVSWEPGPSGGAVQQ